MNANIVSELSRCFPAEDLLTKPEDVMAYSYDGTPMMQQLPLAVVFATSPEQVATVLRLATETGVAVVTRGSGTGLSAGSVPLPGSIVLCLARMNRILELDAANLTMLVEPGVINMEVATKADAVGLFYPPDPGSMKVSTILDRTTIRCIEEYSHVGLPLDCDAILLLETDGHPAAVDDEAQRMEAIAREHGARSVSLAKDLEEATKLMTARRMAIPAMARVAPTTILEDATVPRSKLPEMVRFVQKTADKYKLIVGTFGHFGDGNLHPTFLANERNPEEIHRVHLAVAEIFEYAVKLD